MPKKYQIMQGRNASTSQVDEFYAQWLETEIKLNEIALYMDNVSSKDERGLRALEAEEHVVLSDQIEVLNSLRLTKCQSIREVLLKLKVWRSISMPAIQNSEDYTVAEQVLISAILELEELT